MTCTCGYGPDHVAQSRPTRKEGSDPETWCRARLLGWVQTEGINLFHPPEGWFIFGTHVDDPTVLDRGLEFWGEDEAGMPLWERRL